MTENVRDGSKWLAIPLLGAVGLGIGSKTTANGPPAEVVKAATARLSLAAAPPVSSTPIAPVDPVALGALFERGEFVRLVDTIPADSPHPTLRLLRGLSAYHAANPTLALEALSGLEVEFPALKTRLAEVRDRARASAPQFREYLPDLARSVDFEVLLGTAERLLKSADRAGSERYVGYASRAVKGQTARELRLRELRAETYLAQDRPFAALADLRWLALEHPETPAGVRATAAIRERFPKHPLTLEDRRKRVERLAERGDLTGLAAEAALLDGTPLALRASEKAHFEGLALFHSAHYEAAAEHLEQAAALEPRYAQSDALKAGRARSRIGQTDAALALFLPIARSLPKSRISMLATYYASQEYALAGRWPDAVPAYDEFLRRFPGSEYRAIAERGRAVGLFALGQIAGARSAFQRLRTSDQAEPGLEGVYSLLDGICLLRLGDQAGALRVFRELAQRLPVSFAGLYARKHLLELGAIAPPPGPAPGWVQVPVRPLPERVAELEQAGLFDFAELELQGAERSLARAWAPTDAGTFCNTYGQLSYARRRFEWGNRGAAELGFFQNPNRMPDWLWRCFYPTPHRELTRQAADTHGVPAALVYAVMRQESGFRPAAVSPAGAYGLMQIIPATAQRIAQALERDLQPDDLYAPKTSIPFGTYYLKHLSRHVGHPALTIAAYNAGPYAIRRLENSSAGLPFELLLLRIPFKETRGYVQRVLANAELYSLLYPELGSVEVPLELKVQTPTDAGAETLEFTIDTEPGLY